MPPSCPCASIGSMRGERRLRTRTAESRAFAERVQVVMQLTSRLNALEFDDLDARNALLGEILGRPVPETVTIYPPFYSDHGLGIELGDRVFVNQGCYFLDLGGISIGDRTMIGPQVTLSTADIPWSSPSGTTSSPTRPSSSSRTSGSGPARRSRPG